MLRAGFLAWIGFPVAYIALSVFSGSNKAGRVVFVVRYIAGWGVFSNLYDFHGCIAEGIRGPIYPIEDPRYSRCRNASNNAIHYEVGILLRNPNLPKTMAMGIQSILFRYKTLGWEGRGGYGTLS